MGKTKSKISSELIKKVIRINEDRLKKRVEKCNHTFRLEEPTFLEFKRKCGKNGFSVNQVIGDLVKLYVDHS